MSQPATMPVQAGVPAIERDTIRRVALHSDRTGERNKHVASACALAALGLVACTLLQGHPTAMMIALIVAAMGQMSIAPTFWTLPTAMLSGTAASVSASILLGLGHDRRLERIPTRGAPAE